MRNYLLLPMDGKGFTYSLVGSGMLIEGHLAIPNVLGTIMIENRESKVRCIKGKYFITDRELSKLDDIIMNYHKLKNRLHEIKSEALLKYEIQIKDALFYNLI